MSDYTSMILKQNIRLCLWLACVVLSAGLLFAWASVSTISYWNVDKVVTCDMPGMTYKKAQKYLAEYPGLDGDKDGEACDNLK